MLDLGGAAECSESLGEEGDGGVGLEWKIRPPRNLKVVYLDNLVGIWVVQRMMWAVLLGERILGFGLGLTMAMVRLLFLEGVWY